MNVVVREERPEDNESVREVNQLAFGSPTEANLVEELRRRGAVVLSLVAESDAQVTGHILFSPVVVHSPDFRGSALGLGPMAVLPHYQRRGVGSLLVREGLRRCKAAGYSLVVVLGHPEYYPKFGFRPGHELGLCCEYTVPPEAFMALELVPCTVEVNQALITYHPAFQTG